MNKKLTIENLKKSYLDKEFSPTELVKNYFEEIEKKEKELNSFISILKDEAYIQASEADKKLEEGDISNVFGLPIAIKDNILIEGTKATAASKILKNYISSYDATVVKKLRENNSIFLGKTNMDEFAMGSSTENSSFGVTKNPVDQNRVPGGSSGGSAVAVASGEALAALGSDTGGSIRQPAAFCGVVGLKPTYGAVSRHGLIAMASSLDQIGPITKTVKDSALLFNLIKGKDEKDSTSFDYDFSFGKRDLKDIKKLKIGIPKEYFSDDLDSEVERGINKVINSIKSLGLSFKEISLPHTKYALPCYYIIMPAEVSSNLARFDGIRYSREINADDLEELYFKNRGEGFGLEVKRRILTGTFVLSSGYYDAYYNKAQKVRSLIKSDFEKVFEEVDVILAPTTPTTAFKIGEKAEDPISMYLSDIFTVPSNLAGVPAISIPVKDYKTDEGLPVGFQLIGNHERESDILDLGIFYEGLFE